MDLIYGLPKQTPDSFDRTLAQVAELRPDRIALYAYAHLPERFKPQRRIVWADLPMASAKVSMLARSLEAFSAAGYVYVGMDHFALPDDALAIAKAPGASAPQLSRLQHAARLRPDCAQGCRQSGAWAPRTARTPKPWTIITTDSTRATCRWCAAWH